jgi:hypothetical protein
MNRRKEILEDVADKLLSRRDERQMRGHTDCILNYCLTIGRVQQPDCERRGFSCSASPWSDFYAGAAGIFEQSILKSQSLALSNRKRELHHSAQTKGWRPGSVLLSFHNVNVFASSLPGK